MHPNSHHITDALLVKYLLSEASPEEVRTVEAWAGESAENKAYLEQLRQVWEASRKLVPVLGADENAAWQRFQARIEQRRAPIRPMRSAGAWMRIAALFILMAGAALVVYLGNREAPVQYLTLQAAGRPLADTLSDGSVVTLNKNASLSYPDRFTGEQRAVTLSGEAFFSITPDKEKPFIITVNDVTVKVVGTSFNVRSEGGKTEVIVETGVVDVIRDNKVIRLRPKEKAVVKKDSAMYKVEETEKLYNHYRTREFVCDGTPLWKLVAVLNEAYDARIVIGRDDLRNLPLNTTFHNESLDRILEIIGATFDITVTRRNDQIILH